MRFRSARLTITQISPSGCTYFFDSRDRLLLVELAVTVLIEPSLIKFRLYVTESQ